MTRRILLAALMALFALPLRAEQAQVLYEKLRLTDMIDIMRVEGLGYGDTLAGSMFPGGSNDSWEGLVSEIYDTDRMEAVVRAQFSDALKDVDTAPLLQFFDSQTGQEVVALELGARQALVDEAVEETARETFRAMDKDLPRLQQVEAFIAANDLIEANVAGALNAHFKFYAGMVDGGALDMSESDILADVWAQEEDTRSDTAEWLHAFLLMAYQPLDEAAMQAYLDLSESPEGRALNRALFGAFNQMYDDISYALGLAVASQMQVQEL